MAALDRNPCAPPSALDRVKNGLLTAPELTSPPECGRVTKWSSALPPDQTVDMGPSDAVGSVLAADIGGTQMRAAMVRPDGTVLNRRTERTPRHAEAPAALVELISSAATEFGRDQVSHAVVGLPGGVDYEAGRLLFAPNLPPEWPDQLTCDSLAERLGMPVCIANDADLAAVGEAYFGAGRGGTDVAYLTISTGVGAGVLHRRRLMRGRYSAAELGHTVIDWRSWREGEPATLEELGSGSGLARVALERGLGELDAQAIGVAASEGDLARSRSGRRRWRRAPRGCRTW